MLLGGSKSLWNMGKGEGGRGRGKGAMRKHFRNISYSMGVGSEPLWSMRREKNMCETEEGVSVLIWQISQGDKPFVGWGLGRGVEENEKKRMRWGRLLVRYGEKGE